MQINTEAFPCVNTVIINVISKKNIFDNCTADILRWIFFYVVFAYLRNIIFFLAVNTIRQVKAANAKWKLFLVFFLLLMFLFIVALLLILTEINFFTPFWRGILLKN
jgi:hypothetical protein